MPPPPSESEIFQIRNDRLQSASHRELQKEASQYKKAGLIHSNISRASKQQLRQEIQEPRRLLGRISRQDRNQIINGKPKQINKRYHRFKRYIPIPKVTGSKQKRAKIIQHYADFQNLHHFVDESTAKSRRAIIDELNEETNQNISYFSSLNNHQLIDQLANHRREQTRRREERRRRQTTAPSYELVQDALEGAGTEYRIYPGSLFKDAISFFGHIWSQIDTIVRPRLEQSALKVIPALTVEFVRESNPDETVIYSFKEHSITLMPEDDIFDQFQDIFETIQDEIQHFNRYGSDFIVNRIQHLTLNISIYDPMAGGCQHEPLPEDVKGVMEMRACPQDQCGLYAILAGLFHREVNDTKNKSHCSQYRPYLNHLELGQKNKECQEEHNIFDGFEEDKSRKIQFPMTVEDIKLIEELNKEKHLSINLYQLKKGDNGHYPAIIRSSKPFDLKTLDNHVNLLLHNEHYYPIINFNSFSGNKRSCVTCFNCLQKFFPSRHTGGKDVPAQEKYEDHIANGCYDINEGTRQILPKKSESILSFKNEHCQNRHPLVIYADMEAIVPSTHEAKGTGTIYQEHKPYSINMHIVAPNYPEYHQQNKLFIANEDDPAEHQFMKYLNETVDDEIAHDIRQDIFDDIRAENPKKKVTTDPRYSRFHIPIFFHNGNGYDSHLLVQEMVNQARHSNKRINVLPKNTEQFIAYGFGNITFKDSLSFLPSSLAKLTDNLLDKGKDKFNNLYDFFRRYYNVTDKTIEYLFQKGVFPYSYLNGEAERMQSTSLPPKEFFHDDLHNKDISDEDYQYAQHIWDTFHCQTMQDYHDIYLYQDVLLLADIFENFRDSILHHYHLDPVYYFGAPGLAWDAFLRVVKYDTHYKINLLHKGQEDMLLFWERGKRGGMSMITHRFAQANNPYMKNYDNTQPNRFIMYFDAGNLYGWAMQQMLPIGGFVWRDPNEWDTQSILELNPTQNSKGYLFEVDLHYPSHLYNHHRDYPCAVESIPGEYSPCMKSIAEKMERPNESSSERKLISTLRNKPNYVVHSRNLQQYLNLGLELTQVHRVLEFDQAPIMKPYIDKTTALRKSATNEFEKDLFKLMCNSVFGKTIENVRNYSNTQYISTKANFLKAVQKPTFKDFTIINQNFVAVEQSKQSITFNKPIFLGISILDISKTLMYDFHYNYIKRLYGDKAILLFTDTDSLCYQIETNDPYEDMKSNKEWFDMADYDKSSHLYDPVHKKTPGYFKDEVPETVPIEFAGVKAKMYSLLREKEIGSPKRTAKGIPQAVMRKSMSHAQYVQAVCDQTEQPSVSFNSIKSFLHRVVTLSETKAGLNPLDDKRYVESDGVHTVPHGYYDES